MIATQSNNHNAHAGGGGMMVGGPDPEVMAAIERGNAVVFFDVALGEGANSAELGRIKVELFVKDVSVRLEMGLGFRRHLQSVSNSQYILFGCDHTVVSENVRELSTALYRGVSTERAANGI